MDKDKRPDEESVTLRFRKKGFFIKKRNIVLKSELTTKVNKGSDDVYTV